MAKIRGLNYLEAREALRKEEKILLAEGDAYDMRDVLERLLQFDVKYEIEPPYPYGLQERNKTP